MSSDAIALLALAAVVIVGLWLRMLTRGARDRTAQPGHPTQARRAAGNGSGPGGNGGAHDASDAGGPDGGNGGGDGGGGGD